MNKIWFAKTLNVDCSNENEVSFKSISIAGDFLGLFTGDNKKKFFSFLTFAFFQICLTTQSHLVHTDFPGVPIQEPG